MASHELMIGENQDGSLKQDHSTGMRRDHGTFPGHAYNYLLGNIHDRDAEMGLSLEHDVVWDHDQEHKTVLQDALIDNVEGNEEQGFNGNDEPGSHHNHNDSYDGSSSLTIPNKDLDFLGNDKLAMAESPELNKSLQFGMVPLSTVPPMLQSQPPLLLPNYELTVGREFLNVLACRRALRDAAIALRFEMQTVKSDKSRFTAKCAREGCPWRIHCAKLPGVPTFTIRTIHEKHTCGGMSHLGHQQASVQWVADAVAEQLKENPHCKPKEILEEIHRIHGIALSYKQAWRGKERIVAAVSGSFEEDYRLLPQYCEQLKRANPGSIALVHGNPVDGSFQQLFVSFQASINGFLDACQTLIGLDKAVLKSKYLGTLFLATGFDGDGAVFPLAFAVVDEENDANWQWFLSELHHLLEINAENMPKLTILSRRDKFIIDGVEANFPTAFHGFFVHHLTERFQKEFNNSILVNLLWEAAHALTVFEFETKVLEIEQMSQEAAIWIRNIPPGLWATAYFEGTRFGLLTANITESLNSWVSDASGLPVIQMMESIRRQLMALFNKRRESSMAWTGLLVPSAERQVLEATEQSRAYQVLKTKEAEVEIITNEGNFAVDIRTRSCMCRGWQLHGLPCGHAVAALLSCRQNVYRFTESYFTVANYRRAYSQTIHPVPDKALWKEMSNSPEEGNADLEVVIRPPKSFPPPVRRRKRRARPEDGGRVKRMVSCSRCNQTGHFRTTCTAPV